VRVGSTFVESPCPIAVGTTYLSIGEPPIVHGDPPVIPPNPCRGLEPVRLRNARRVTITLLGQTPQMGASWYEGTRSMPLAVRPVGSPPTAIWLLSLPLSSGKLVLHLWFPVTDWGRGTVTQDRADYKLAIRRQATRLTGRPPAPCPPPLQTSDDRG
jgi:hypothetical protein